MSSIDKKCTTQPSAETRIFGNKYVNTMAADALAACVAKSSAAMILAMPYKLTILFHTKNISTTCAIPAASGWTENANIWFLKSFRTRTVNTSWINDTIWPQRFGTLAQVMAWCLMAPSPYLNQRWLIISRVIWHSPQTNLTGSAQDITT